MRNLSLLVLGFSSVMVCSFSTARGAGAFYGDPPDERHPWAIHDMNRPKPPTVQPGSFSTHETAGKPPSDAIVLFDGTNLDGWRSAKAEGGGTRSGWCGMVTWR